MKNLYKFTLALAVMLISGSAFAQETDDTELEVIVKDVFNLTVGQDRVTLSLISSDDFITGVTNTSSDHLQITATGNYTVNVKASSDKFLASDLTESVIGVQNVDVVVTTLGTDLSGNSSRNPNFTSARKSLSSADQVILKGGNPDLKRGYDVEYSIPASKTEKFLGKEAGAYTTTVTYTLIPDA